jgi:hypothetical protein
LFLGQLAMIQRIRYSTRGFCRYRQHMDATKGINALLRAARRPVSPGGAAETKGEPGRTLKSCGPSGAIVLHPETGLHKNTRMRRPRMRSMTCVLFLLLPSCAASVAEYNAESREKIRPRAAFEMNCAALTFTPLLDSKVTGVKEGLVSQCGVEGCGKRSVYVHTDSGWIANTASEQGK